MWDWFGGKQKPEPVRQPSADPQSGPDLAVVFGELVVRLPEMTAGKLKGFLIGRRVSDGALAEWLGRNPGAASLVELRLLAGLGGELGRVAVGLVREQSLEPEVEDAGEGRGRTSQRSPTSAEVQIPPTPEGEDLDLSAILESQDWEFYCSLSSQVRQDKIDQLQQLLNLTESDRHKAEIWRQVGRLWSAEGDCLVSIEAHQKALAGYEKAIEYKPDKHEAWNNRGLSLDDQHEAWLNRGVSLAALGQLEEAIASYDKAIEYKPDFHEAWNNRGNSLAALGRREEAIASWEKAIDYKPDLHEAWYNRGVSLAALGRREEAIASYEKAIEYKPDYHEAWYNRGVSLDALGHKDEAIASYEKAIEYKPDKHEAWSNRGNSLYALGRWEEAIASYEKAIDYKPDLHEAWTNRGISAKVSTQAVGTALFASPALMVSRTPYTPAALLFGNPDLNLRGFPGQLASLTEGLRRCPSPLGQGFLFRYLGEAHWDQGQTAYNQSNPAAARDAWREARRAYDQALGQLEALATDPTGTDLYLQALQGQLRVFLALGDLPAARALQTKGITRLDHLRRTLPPPQFTTQYGPQYNAISRLEIDLLLDEDQPHRALEQAERYKNRTLTWILDDWNQTPISPSYPQLRELLTPTTAILYWHLSQDTLTTFILTPDQPNPIVLDVDRRRQAYKLHQLLTDYKHDYTAYTALPKDAPGETRQRHPWRQQLNHRLTQLRQILAIDQILSHLPNTRHLILLPHRDLHLLPLQSYFTQPSTTLPSLQIGLNLPSHPTNAPTTLLNIDDPAIPDQPPLKFARIESALLRALLPNYHHLSGTEATHLASLQALQTHQGICHVSGHGSHDPRNPENSAIAFTDHPLTAKAIASLDLSAYALINLAACETGLTAPIADLEYIGLPSACLKAHAQSVLSTLWPVNELSSAWLTIRFYQAYLGGERPADALAIAQTWLKTITYSQLADWLEPLLQGNPKLDYSDQLQAHLSNIQENPDKMSSPHPPFADPYYWAGFTLSGR